MVIRNITDINIITSIELDPALISGGRITQLLKPCMIKTAIISRYRSKKGHSASQARIKLLQGTLSRPVFVQQDNKMRKTDSDVYNHSKGNISQPDRTEFQSVQQHSQRRTHSLKATFPIYPPQNRMNNRMESSECRT